MNVKKLVLRVAVASSALVLGLPGGGASAVGAYPPICKCPYDFRLPTVGTGASSTLPDTGPTNLPMMMSVGSSIVLTGGLVLFASKRRRSTIS